MKYILTLLLTIVCSSAAHSQSEVKIGNQIWMSKNLDVSTFRNGESIPEAKNKEQWAYAAKNKIPAYCYYNFNSKNGVKYGKLYNWYAVKDPRGLAPPGYHIPSDLEWSLLTEYLGGESIAGLKMKSTSGWYDNRNGDNTSGFKGLPGGNRGIYGIFFNIGSDGCWWSSTEYNTYDAWFRILRHNYGIVYRLNYGKDGGLSVRCLRD